LDLGLKGRVAIVTGGSRGIGKACAKELLAEGAIVVLVSKNPDSNAAAVHELGRLTPTVSLVCRRTSTMPLRSRR
jgi:3-oxoacyl-[acyl-carrier protein] reductase